MKRKIFAIFAVILLAIGGASAVSAQQHLDMPYENTAYISEGHEHFYPFKFEANTWYIMTLEVPDTGEFDLFIDNANFKRIKSSGANTFGTDEKIEWRCETTDTYYVVVSCWPGDGYGTYTLYVDEVDEGSCLGTLLVTIFLVTAVVSYSLVRFHRKKL